MIHSRLRTAYIFAIVLTASACAGVPNLQNTPLHTAADAGNLQEVERLLESGAEVDARNRYGDTPLHEAAAAGHPRVVTRLLDAGAEVNALDDFGDTPLHAAQYTDNVEVWEHLLTAGGDIDTQSSDYGYTPITAVARDGNLAAPLTALQRLGRARVLLATGLEGFTDKTFWEAPGALWENDAIVLSKALDIGPSAEFTILARFVHTSDVNRSASLLWGSDRPLVKRASSNILQIGIIGSEHEAWEEMSDNPSGYMRGPVSYHFKDASTSRNQKKWTYLPTRSSTLLVIDRRPEHTRIIPRGEEYHYYTQKITRSIGGGLYVEEPKYADIPAYKVPSEPLIGSRFGYWVPEGIELDYLVVVQFTEPYFY